MKTTAYEHRIRIEQLRPAMAHSYFFGGMTRMQVAKKYNCSGAAVSTAVNMYTRKDVEGLYGNNETIIIIPIRHMKEVLSCLKELSIPHRLPSAHFVLKEYYGSAMNEDN